MKPLLQAFHEQPAYAKASADKVGREGFEPSKQLSNRFTVCPIWPLWYLPDSTQIRADGGIRTPDQLITNQLLWPTELHRLMLQYHILKNFRAFLPNFSTPLS